MPDHKDRLTSVDASFLVQEKRSSHMHVGAILLFEGPPPDYTDFLGGIEFACFVLQHHRNSVANRESESVGPAHQFMRILAMQQRPLAQRADENFKQSRIDHG